MFELTPFFFGNRAFPVYDPFKEMEELEHRFFGRQLPTFQTDIRETQQAYVIDAELPGFSKEEISAEIKDDVLTIRAERHANTEPTNENDRYLRRERSYGSFTRSFGLKGIRREEISAAYKDGILTITLPKEVPEAEKTKKLEIM